MLATYLRALGLTLAVELPIILVLLRGSPRGLVLAAQGGDPEELHDLPRARHMKPFTAKQAGYLAAVDCEGVGLAVMKLGAGRATKDDVIYHAVGFEILKRIGDKVAPGDMLNGCELLPWSTLEYVTDPYTCATQDGGVGDDGSGSGCNLSATQAGVGVAFALLLGIGLVMARRRR